MIKTMFFLFFFPVLPVYAGGASVFMYSSARSAGQITVQAWPPGLSGIAAGLPDLSALRRVDVPLMTIDADLPAAYLVSAVKNSSVFPPPNLPRPRPCFKLRQLQYVLLNLEKDLFGLELSADMAEKVITMRDRALKELMILSEKNGPDQLFQGESKEYADLEDALGGLLSALEKSHKEGYPSHTCWNDCRRMCQGSSVCHIICFHCCQTQGQGPIYRL